MQDGPASMNIEVLASGPLDASGVTADTKDGDRAKQWYVAVLNASGPARQFKVFAICSRVSDAVIEASGFSVGHGQVDGHSVACPRRKRALGGGVVQSGPSVGIEMHASGPQDATGDTLNTRDGDKAKRWYAAVANFSGGRRQFKVFAICSRDSNATIEATPIEVGADEIVEAFAVCPSGKELSVVASCKAAAPTGSM